MKYLLTLLLFFLLPLSLNAENVSRYIDHQSYNTIAGLHWEFGKGLYSHKDKLHEKLTLALSGDLKPIELSGELQHFLSDKNIKVQVDGYDAKILDVLNRLLGYIFDTYHEGSIEYSYEVPYEGWLIKRSVVITDNNIFSKVEVYGQIYSRIDDPSVYTNVNYACLTLRADESDRTNIRTTMTLGYSQSYGARCGLVRNISARVAPEITRYSMVSEIDGILYNLTGSVESLILQGRSNKTIVDEWLDLLKDIRIQSQRFRLLRR